MRGTIAKKLRKVAEEETKDFPDRMLLKLPNGQLINSPNSKRGFYRRLKKQYKRQRQQG